MRRTIRTHLLALSSVLGGIVLTGCAGDDGQADDTDASSSGSTDGTTSSTAPSETTSTLGETSTDATSSPDDTTTGETSSTGDDTTTDDTGTTTGGEVAVEVLVDFDPAAFELPEGLYIDGGDAVVGFAFTGAIERISLTDGARSALVATPPPPPNTSFVTGVTLDDDGQIYAAVVSFTADLAAGIYRAPANGGDAELWASDPALVFPNGFAWDDAGLLYVSDSVYGGVFTVEPDGTVAPWVQDPLLAGAPTECGGTSDIAVGANGIALTDGALLVAGSDLGALLRVPIEADGSAGTPETIALDCSLAGIDGIARDDDGTTLAAINRSNQLVRIADDGEVGVIAEGPPLDFPATVALEDDGSILVTSFALGAFLGGGAPAPALVRVTE